jgi:hypothetical protein
VTAVDLLASVVRGDVVEWPAGIVAEGSFVDAAIDHSVEALVVWQLRRAGTFDRWPPAIQTRLAQLAREEALLEAGRERELRGVLAALHDAAVRCVAFKGAALAYSRYPEPWLRPRNDNDLLVPADDVAAADRVMKALGYEPPNVLTGEFVGHQTPYVKTDPLGLRHVVEIHWKVNNRPLLADVPTFDEVWPSAVAVPALGDSARAPNDVHALLIACLHPASHHYNSDNLVWAYDVHLLASRLVAGDLDEFVAVARRKRVAAICAGALQRAVDRFHTPVPRPALAALSVEGEPSAILLDKAAWRGDVRLSDLRSLPTWAAKLRLIREVALPGAEFMLKEYEAQSRVLLPAFHVHRLARGTWRLIRRFAH